MSKNYEDMTLSERREYWGLVTIGSWVGSTASIEFQQFMIHAARNAYMAGWNDAKKIKDGVSDDE